MVAEVEVEKVEEVVVEAEGDQEVHQQHRHFHQTL
jgi:hypothetical protein